MKKLLIIPLLLFYLGSISGMNINVHYCCGKIKYISVFDTKEKMGCCGSKKKSKHCCHDKTTIVKLADEHQSTHHLKVPNPTLTYTDILIPVHSFRTPVPGLPICYKAFLYKPPIFNPPALYLNNRVLLL